MSLTDVSPAHASILFTFADIGLAMTLSLQSVSAAVKLPPSLVRRKLDFWVQKRILFVSDSGMYGVIEYTDGIHSSPISVTWEDDEDEESVTFSLESVCKCLRS